MLRTLTKAGIFCTLIGLGSAVGPFALKLDKGFKVMEVADVGLDDLQCVKREIPAGLYKRVGEDSNRYDLVVEPTRLYSCIPYITYYEDSMLLVVGAMGFEHGGSANKDQVVDFGFNKNHNVSSSELSCLYLNDIAIAKTNTIEGYGGDFLAWLRRGVGTPKLTGLDKAQFDRFKPATATSKPSKASKAPTQSKPSKAPRLPKGESFLEQSSSSASAEDSRVPTECELWAVRVMMLICLWILLGILFSIHYFFRQFCFSSKKLESTEADIEEGGLRASNYP